MGSLSSEVPAFHVQRTLFSSSDDLPFQMTLPGFPVVEDQRAPEEDPTASVYKEEDLHSLRLFA